MEPHFNRTTSDKSKSKTDRNNNNRERNRNRVKFDVDQCNQNSNQSQTQSTSKSEATGTSGSNKSTCSCTNISIMQLFHEMKQEYPTVPDQIVSQLVTENCHNRIACLESLKKESLGHPTSTQVYPSLSIHNSKSLFSSLSANANNNNIVNNTSNNKMSVDHNQINQNQNQKSPKNIRQLNEHLKKSSDMSCNNNNSNNNSHINNNTNNIKVNNTSDNNSQIKRPTTLSLAKDSQYPLVLRRAPPPPIGANSPSTPSPSSSSANSSSLSSPSISTSHSSQLSLPHPHHQLQQQQQQQQQHVLIDSQGIKSNDSLNVQLNVTVSPLSVTPDGLPPIPPRPPLRPPRHTTQLQVQPDLPYSSILDSNNNQISRNGQRSYTSVNFMLRQPTGILPSVNTPIDIQAGPSSLTYSSSSFDAKQGYQSHLKITVAGNGESCFSAVRTKNPASPLSSQIDTTINIGESNETSLVKIPQINTGKRAVGLTDFDNEVQQISLQKKQKEVIECELRREKEKLNMVKFDVTTLSETKVTRTVIQILKEDIQKLRAIIKELADELDEMGVDVLGDVNAVVSRTQSSPSSGSLPRRRPPRPPPPIPQALRSNQAQRSPLHDYNQLYYASNQQFGGNIERSNSQDADGPSWTCSMCTFQNHPLLNQCEECNLPRIQTRAGTIQITSSNFQPLRQNVNYQQSATPSPSPSPSILPTTPTRTLIANNDPNNPNGGSNSIPATVL